MHALTRLLKLLNISSQAVHTSSLISNTKAFYPLYICNLRQYVYYTSTMINLSPIKMIFSPTSFSPNFYFRHSKIIFFFNPVLLRRSERPSYFRLPNLMKTTWRRGQSRTIFFCFVFAAAVDHYSPPFDLYLLQRVLLPALDLTKMKEKKKNILSCLLLRCLI